MHTRPTLSRGCPRRLIENKVRISVSNLDFDFLLPLPDSPKEAAMEKLKTMVDEMIAPKFDMASRAPGPKPSAM